VKSLGTPATQSPTGIDRVRTRETRRSAIVSYDSPRLRRVSETAIPILLPVPKEKSREEARRRSGSAGGGAN